MVRIYLDMFKLIRYCQQTNSLSASSCEIESFNSHRKFRLFIALEANARREHNHLETSHESTLVRLKFSLEARRARSAQAALSSSTNWPKNDRPLQFNYDLDSVTSFITQVDQL